MENNKSFKSLLWLAAVAVAMTACEKQVMDGDDYGLYDVEGNEVRTVRFDVQGSFEQTAFTRAALTADGKQMTDLWVLDYVDGELVQQVHQTNDDADFGQPRLTLATGQHHLYFVCSRGGGPTLATASHTITWDVARDTFWRDLALTVSGGTGSSVSVALDRVSTKVSITISDAIPADLATITITPEVWYYGLDYLTGQPTNAANAGTEVEVPTTYSGTEGRLSITLYGMSAAEEWTTDIGIVARDADDDILGQATINAAPFLRNRATNYKGALFTGEPSFAVTLNSEWGEAYNETW